VNVRADTTSRIGTLATLFLAVLWAHALLPGTLPFALALPCLCGLAILRIDATAARSIPYRASGPPGEPVREAPLDDELAVLEAEVHALRDQHLTRLQLDGRQT